MVRVVGDDESARTQAAFHPCQDVRIKRLRAVKEQHVDPLRKVNAQRLEGIARADLDKVEKTAVL